MSQVKLMGSIESTELARKDIYAVWKIKEGLEKEFFTKENLGLFKKLTFYTVAREKFYNINKYDDETFYYKFFDVDETAFEFSYSLDMFEEEPVTSSKKN